MTNSDNDVYMHRLQEVRVTQRAILDRISKIESTIAEILSYEMTRAPRIVGSVRG